MTTDRLTGCTTIRYGTGHPICQHQRSPPPEMLDSTVILIWKKNRDLHFCKDYRKLNDVIRKDCFSLPQTEDTLDMLAGAK